MILNILASLVLAGFLLYFIYKSIIHFMDYPEELKGVFKTLKYVALFVLFVAAYVRVIMWWQG